MKIVVFRMALVCALSAALPAVAQNSAADSNAAVNVLTSTTALNVGPAGYNCGRVTTNDYCYGIPLNDGTMWLDAQPGGGFVMVYGKEYPVTSPFERLQQSKDSTQMFTLTVNFGQSSSLTIHYTTYYSAGGGGRGGAGAGYRWVLQPSSTMEFNE